MGVSSPASSYVAPQGEAKGTERGSCKTAVIRDNAEEARIPSPMGVHNGRAQKQSMSIATDTASSSEQC